MLCRTCPSPLPVVSARLVAHIARNIPEGKRMAIMLAAYEWLLTKHEGIDLCLGASGRRYTDQERVAVHYQTAAVHGLACPYRKGEGCLIEQANPKIRIWRDLHPPYLWLPTGLLREFDKPSLSVFVRQKEVADAKIALLKRDEAFGI